ncbi:MAG: hypothetical protein ACN4A7_05795 [Thermacetogeniaceae bacterium]|jgi:hypothetical protein|nr:hypothetical protein [Thermoanaerobacterales bacterium]NLN20556.1 hypothetical protein [Syntrophomonadaceae bacterium]
MEEHQTIKTDKRQNDPEVRFIFAGGDGVESAFCFLGKKVLELMEKEGKKDCAPRSISG